MEVLFVLIGLMLLTVIVVAIGDKIGLPWPALLTILTAVAVTGFATFSSSEFEFEVPADLILPVFLPPLLWALARRTSWGVIREQWVTILSLSVLLVVATTFTVGFTAKAYMPGLSLAGAILIGAAIAPPDPVAVDAVAEPAGIPRRIISALQTEGLFNDAASIVAFHLALEALTTESEGIHASTAILDFLYSAGMATLLGLGIGRLASWYIKHVHDVIARNALTWVIPFAVYIGAEELHASGVIAVVIAAVELHSRAPIQAEDRLSGQSFWETIELLFTGVAFGLIGLTVSSAVKEADANLGQSVIIGIILSLVAFVVRLVWMYAFYRINLRRGKPGLAPLRLQEVLLMAWSGMRGLVTLALVLSVPNTFQFYNQLTIIALTVLLMTMVIPGMLLPWLMKQLDLTTYSQAASDKMRATITSKARKAGLASMRKKYEELDPDIAANIAQWFEDRLGEDEDGEDANTRIQMAIQARDIAVAARRTALAGAQQELLRLRRDRNFNPQIVDEVLEEVDRMTLGTRRS